MDQILGQVEIVVSKALSEWRVVLNSRVEEKHR